MMNYSGKRIAVIGLGRTGLAVADVMCSLGASVAVYDAKQPSELGNAIEMARSFGAEVYPGTNEVCLEGVDMLIPSPGVPKNHPTLIRAQTLGVEIISEVELAYRISRCPVVAVTGTNGKTTTTVLIGLIMAADGRRTYVAGNVAGTSIETPCGVCEGPVPFVKAAQMADPESVIVAEVSSFQLEWVKSFKPRVGVLLNVSCDHLDRYSDLEEYVAYKARMFENQTCEEYAVVNNGDSVVSALAKGFRSHILSFTTKSSEVAEGAFVHAGEIIVRINGKESRVCSCSDVQIPGEHNLENVMAAVCAAAALGASLNSVAFAIRDFRGVEHRLETVAVIDGVRYVNNSMCTNVEAAVRSAEAIDAPQIVIAGGKDKGSDFSPLIEIFKRKARHVILIGSDAGTIKSAAEKLGFHAISLASSLDEAVAKARSIALPGDVVMLNPACASFDMFQSFEHRGQVFREIVRRYDSKQNKGIQARGRGKAECPEQ
ncbi:MAG: UDP-N-acetylmuramoyl-L-alanine--D-glutamate ligase [Armatimonadota bacterium]